MGNPHSEPHHGSGAPATPMCPTAWWHSLGTDRHRGRTPQLGCHSRNPRPRDTVPAAPQRRWSRRGARQGVTAGATTTVVSSRPQGWEVGGSRCGRCWVGTAAIPGRDGWERGLQPLTPGLPARPRAGEQAAAKPRGLGKPGAAGAPPGWGRGQALRWLGRTPQHLRPPREAPALSCLLSPHGLSCPRQALPAQPQPSFPPATPVQTSPSRGWAQGLPSPGGGSWDGARARGEPPHLHQPGRGPLGPPHCLAAGTAGGPGVTPVQPAGCQVSRLLALPGCRVSPLQPQTRQE